jgi:hypothetical protein
LHLVLRDVEQTLLRNEAERRGPGTTNGAVGIGSRDAGTLAKEPPGHRRHRRPQKNRVKGTRDAQSPGKPALKHQKAISVAPAKSEGKVPTVEETPQTLAELGDLQKEDVLRKLVEKLEGRASTLAANLKLEANHKVDGEAKQASGLKLTAQCVAGKVLALHFNSLVEGILVVGGGKGGGGW